MNVIAADMCTNARRVRKRWLPKIKSMLPDGMEVYRNAAGAGLGLGVGGAQAAAAAVAAVGGVALPFEAEFKSLTPAGLAFEQRLYGERKDGLRTHLPLGGASPEATPEGAEPEMGGAAGEEEPEDEEEEEAGLESAEGGAGGVALATGAEVGGGCQPCTPEGQKGEDFGEGLRLNGQ